MVIVSELVAFLGAVELDAVDGVVHAETVVVGLVVPPFNDVNTMAAVSEVMLFFGAVRVVVD